jgi:hypothetical protein
MVQERSRGAEGAASRSAPAKVPLRRSLEQAREEGTRLVRHTEQMLALAREWQLERRRRRWWRTWSWLVLTAMAAAAYGLLVAYEQGSLPQRMLDALKFFPSGFPGSDPSVPWQYLLGRYLIAVVSVFVTLRILVALFAERVGELRARLRRHHAVVCGLGEKGLRSARAFRAAGYPVTCFDLDPVGDIAEAARNLGALVLKGDATQLVTLRTARVDRAEHVVCACADDATNTRVASLVASLSRRREHGPDVYVHIRDPELAQLLRTSASGLGSLSLHFFNIHRVWARALLDDPAGPFAALGTAPPRIAVMGGTALGTAVVVGAARRWHEHARATGSSERATIALVAPAAQSICEEVAARYAAIPRTCRLAAVPDALGSGHLPDLAAVLGEGLGPTGVYVCLDDHSLNLALALEAEHSLDLGTPVFLPAAAAAAELGPLLLAGPGHVHAVGLPHVGSPDLLYDQMREALAEAVHEAWLADRRPAADFGSRPADRPWEELGEDHRRANRRHVDGVLEQLQAVWWEVEPRYDWDESLEQLSDAAVEAMAELEHARWCRERRAAGWRFARERDDARRLHNLLVPWVELPDEVREIDRVLARARPALLARAGYRLERSPAHEILARRIHEEYVRARREAGDDVPYAVGWEELPERVREYNRTSVDHIAVKLARIGCRIVPSALAPRHEAVLSEQEIELMAELEHERWVAERLAGGWTLGPRDDEAMVHPMLVPYAELPESEKEKDREVVRAIPALLASAGYCIARDPPYA